jgi:predicted RNase H-like HicB family nuclease
MRADEAGWIVARVLEVPGAVSQGRSREKARENVVDGLQEEVGDGTPPAG